MDKHNRHAITLIVVAVILFIPIWFLNGYMSDVETWRSATQKDAYGKPVLWRPAEGEGKNFFDAIFRGGSGTPAVLAMFGGQRYLIANILWTYSDVLFHEGKPFEMVHPQEATVTLNPSFLEAWSVYGWHLAWNLHSYTPDGVLKAKYIRDGETVYKRAVLANPENPLPYFDLAWLYTQRIGNYEEARIPLEYVVYGKDAKGKPLFEPMAKADREQMLKLDIPAMDKKWLPKQYGNRLAYVYKKLGIVTGDQAYFDKAIAVYELTLKYDATDDAAKDNMERLKASRYDAAWLKAQQMEDATLRANYGMPPLDYGKPAKELFSTEDQMQFSNLQ